jgi:glycosidase
MTVLNGDPARARVAASAMLLLPGTPFVYYGEEIGMIGDKPDEQIRTPMQWSAANGGGFTKGTPWEKLQPDWLTRNVASQDGDAASLLNHYRRLIHLRNAYFALSRGELIVGATNNASTAAYVRRSGDESVLVVVNFGNSAVTSVTASFGTRISAKARMIYADPGSDCDTLAVRNSGKSVILASIAGYGLCVFR